MKPIEAWAIIIDGRRLASRDNGTPILYVESEACRLAALHPTTKPIRVRITPAASRKRKPT